MARMTLEQIVQANPQVDAAKLDAATEADIRRWQIEDGFDPDARPKEVRVVLPPRVIRMALSMTQEEFAAALRIPVATLRNWEQGRVMPDPAARSLLAIVAHDAKAAFAALTA